MVNAQYSISNVAPEEAVNIAFGRSRRETSWRNREILWADFVARLAEPHYTHETMVEYVGYPKARQNEIKDVGGFVGGIVSGGRRKNGSITNRQILTLDIDNAKDLSIIDDYAVIYGCAAVVYSTHKHSPEMPRLRLCILLDKPVFADAYEAIGRRIASTLGIDAFDPTTFEPARLMFWQSTPKDGRYYFRYIDGEAMPADEILGTYCDWRDISAWATHSGVQEAVKREIKKQGDPEAKPGLIGAFCREYSIEAAIDKFLADEYRVCDVEGRYTYAHGSTAAGLVLYEDKFAFSHHGTDPASGKLCNAFDLVRLHKFGLRDENAKDGTPPNKLPSYKAMMELLRQDKPTKTRAVREKLADTQDDFNDGFQAEAPDDEQQETDDSWHEALETDQKGEIKSTTNNVLLIMTRDPKLTGCFAMDEFEHRCVILKNLPWRKRDPQNPYYSDLDDAGLQHYLERHYNIAAEKKIVNGWKLIAHTNRFHPVRDYLSGLVWDGLPRLDTLLIEYWGARDNAYTRAVSRKTLVAAVARIFQPGIKFDWIQTLVGAQGAGKSSFYNKLGRGWFSDSFTTVQGKEACEQLQGVWIVELGEMSVLRKAEIEQIKQFITKEKDRFRVAYGHHPETFPRQCIFVGTTNNIEFLKDPTGNRRFWPVDIYTITGIAPTKNIYTDLTEAEVGQIWAEAVEMYKAGEKLYLPKDIEALAREEQERHSEDDGKIGLIREYLERPLPANWYKLEVYERRRYLRDEEALEGTYSDETFQRDKTCAMEIWCELFDGDLKSLDARRKAEITNALLKMDDWAPVDLAKDKGRRRFNLYGSQRAFLRKDVLNSAPHIPATP